MTVELRGHHLLCMLTYVGNGYSSAFAASYDRVIERIGAGEDVRVISGPDAICRALIAEEKEPHCFGERVTGRDRRAVEDVSELFGRDVAQGEELTLTREAVERMRAAFAQGTIRRACDDCPWYRLCTRVSNARYRNVRLFPPLTMDVD